MSIESVESVGSFYSFHNVETAEDSPKVVAEKQAHPVSKKVEESKEKEEISKDKVGKTVESLSQISHLLNTRLTFDFDENTGKNIIRVIDRESGDVIRQIPAQEMLDLVSKLKGVIGMLFDEEA